MENRGRCPILILHFTTVGRGRFFHCEVDQRPPDLSGQKPIGSDLTIKTELFKPLVRRLVSLNPPLCQCIWFLSLWFLSDKNNPKSYKRTYIQKTKRQTGILLKVSVIYVKIKQSKNFFIKSGQSVLSSRHLGEYGNTVFILKTTQMEYKV